MFGEGSSKKMAAFAPTPELVYLDFDIGDARASFARCAHFVEVNDLKYGLSSKDINALGGRERQQIPGLYAGDFVAAQQGPCRVAPQPNCRVVVALHADAAPLACENFAALCRGDRGLDKSSGVSLAYRGSTVHRVLKGFVMQGGDIVKGNGSGGASVFGKKFKDEARGLKAKHDAFVLSMGNSGKNANSSQFFITFQPCPQLDGKHVVFGHVVAGHDVIRAVEAVGARTFVEE